MGILDTGLLMGEAAAMGINDLGPSVDQTDADDDDVLDTESGHGTFIAAIVRHLVPTATIISARVLDSYGVGQDPDFFAGLEKVINEFKDPGESILSLSLGAYTMDDAGSLSIKLLLQEAMAKGVTIVAAAGNDATSRPFFPAALPGVISVGALGPTGPARFTNRGSWVRACSTGVDIVSRFSTFNDELPYGRRAFHGWARWSGTSFAAPRVAAAIARRRVATGQTVDDAVLDLVDATEIVRIPCLGAVVNVL